MLEIDGCGYGQLAGLYASQRQGESSTKVRPLVYNGYELGEKTRKESEDEMITGREGNSLA